MVPITPVAKLCYSPPLADDSRVSNVDSLTGLVSPCTLRDRIERRLRDTPDHAFTLIWLEVTNIKKINNRYGHRAGDAVLEAVAKILHVKFGSTAWIARWGGSDFMVKVPSESVAKVEKIARAILTNLTKPMQINEHHVYPQGVVGVALYPLHGTTLNELLEKAHTAKEDALSAGPGNYRVFDVSMADKADWGMWVEANLRKAMLLGELEVHYQPKVALATKTISSVEALLRWRHPVRGLIPPNLFIPYAEESGLIHQLGLWVLQQSALQAAAWKSQGRNWRIAVNISAKQFKNPSLIRDFKRIVRTTRIDPAMLALELTESCWISDYAMAHDMMHKFRALGTQIHLDDFGTGYSSLAQLTRLPVDVLKLDGSFIQDIAHDTKARALVRSVAAVGQELNMKVVAECVESIEQVNFLSEIGVDFAQGYFFGKPMRADEL